MFNDLNKIIQYEIKEYLKNTQIIYEDSHLSLGDYLDIVENDFSEQKLSASIIESIKNHISREYLFKYERNILNSDGIWKANNGRIVFSNEINGKQIIIP